MQQRIICNAIFFIGAIILNAYLSKVINGELSATLYLSFYDSVRYITISTKVLSFLNNLSIERPIERIMLFKNTVKLSTVKYFGNGLILYKKQCMLTGPHSH
tara:strand:+ start:3483 stop:3788 length:306 start_codon:yes stop_codon:yes gene_type:complete